jgi:2-polyprenyl-3-methyl-5-hydroxy-6-metoxy-1,4-benzoquinol methylase
MTDFDRIAPNYKEIVDGTLTLSGETSEYFAEYKARFTAQELATPGFTGKILDFGCGVGLLSRFLRMHFPASTLHGYDVSADSIGRIDPDLRSHGVFTASVAMLDHDYDVIIVSNVLHHTRPEDRQSLITAVRERLTKTGKVVVFEHNPANPVTRWVVRHSPVDREAHLLPQREILTYLRRAGLHLIRRAYIVFFPHPLAWFRVLEPWLTWFPMGAQYAVVAARAESDGISEGGKSRP